VKIEDLESEMPPSRDLWEGIEREISGEEPRERSSRLGLGFAAAAVALVSSLGTWWWLQPPPSAEIEIVAVSTAEPAVEAWEAEILQTNAELLAHLDAEEHAMDPELVSVIRENLVIMDNAIETVRAAMDADPNNTQLVADLAFVYQRKLDLLRRASEIAG